MIEVKWDNRNVLAALERLSKGAANPRPALLAIGESLKSSTQKRFSTSTAPDGSRWAPNSAVTLKRKKGSKPLVDGGTLRDQIAYTASPLELTLFSTMEYAAVQQFGAKRGQFGQNKRNAPIPWGGIPARPFMGVSVADEQMIVRTVNDYLQSLID